MAHHFNGKIVIIGTGPGALSSAYQLLLNNIKPIIIDSSSSPGGFMRSIEYENYVVDLGRKELYSRIPEVNTFWKELLGKDYRAYDYRIGILYKGSILEKSSKYRGFKRGLKFSVFIECIIDYIISKWKYRNPRNYRDLKYSSQGALMTKIFGQGFYERFTGRKWEDIPLKFDEHINSSIFYIIKKFFSGSGDEKSSQDIWRHPSKGSGQIISKLVNNILDLGGEFLYDVKIQNIQIKNDRIISLEYIQNGKIEKIMPKVVVNSIPLEVSHKLIFNKKLHKDDKNISAQRGTLLVYLFLNNETEIKNTWINVSCPDLKIGRITNYAKFNGEMVPDGKTCFCVEYFLNSDDGFFDFEDEKILEKTYRDCDSIKLFNKCDIENFIILKLKNANAAVSWEDFINDPIKIKLYDELKGIKNMYNINRAGTDCATHAGILASENILDGNKDKFERFTDPKVKDPWESI